MDSSLASFLVYLALLAATAVARVPELSDAVRQRAANPLLPYAPTPGVCPSSQLVRTASGLGRAEAAWFNKKKPRADQALRAWLRRFGSFSASSMPTIGSAVAGGYLRASLLGAGIHQQLDGTEGSGPMAGLLQAIAYETTLSGSGAYQAGLMQNNWPSIHSLSSGLWEPNYATGMSPGKAQGDHPQALGMIVADVGAKSAASYPTTLVDVFGRILGWSNLHGNDGGVSTLMSDARSQSKFANSQVPFPIMTSIGTVNGLSCYPGSNGTHYELTPFEFGSWDHGVKAFMDMKYLGTRMFAGNPATPLCTTGFDNLGFLLATTSNTLAWKCEDVSSSPAGGTLGSGALSDAPFKESISTIVGTATYPLNRAVYAAIPNPFSGFSSSPLIANQPELALVDGGNSGQVIPLWPLLQRSSIDVTFVWDNYYDLDSVETTGQQLYNTFLASQPAGLEKMPTIPTPQIIQAKKLNTRPTAFGCNTPSTQTFIYIPYQAYIPQTQATSNLTTTAQQTRDYIVNGNRLATNNNNSNWPRCVACLVMKKKASSLPPFCSSCFLTYCYN